jgi:putative heme-binding domain-containing protein
MWCKLFSTCPWPRTRRNSFGNSASLVAREEVAKIRAEAGGRNYPWTSEELDASQPGLLRYRPDWKVSASHNAGLAHFAFNGSGFIQWDSAEAQQPGMWFQAESSQPAVLAEIHLDSPPAFPASAPGRYPLGYLVQVSMDGTTWGTSIAEGRGTGLATRIAFKPVQAKVIRFTQTASVDNSPSWSIQRIRLFEVVKEASAEARVPRIGKQPLAEVLAAVERTRGYVSRGQQLFRQLSCTAYHTTHAEATPKGPFLGKTAATLRRRELAESVLLPSMSIAEGYNTYIFELENGKALEGFIVRETKEAVTIRTVAAEEHTIPLKNIEGRNKAEKSLMPDGLAANLTIQDLASLLDYLQSLAPAKP